MTNSIDRIEKVSRSVFSWSARVCAVLTVIWLFIMVTYIAGRPFGLGWLFVEEFTGYWLVFLAYIPLAFVLFSAEGHIRVDIVTKKLPEKTRSVLSMFTDFIGLVLVVYLLWRSIGWLIQGIEFGLHSECHSYILLWPTYLPISIGLLLFGLAFMVKLAKGIADLVGSGKT